MGEHTATWKTKRGSIEATKQLPGTMRATAESLAPPHVQLGCAACQTRPSKPYIPPPWLGQRCSARKAKLFPTHQTDQARVPRREGALPWVGLQKNWTVSLAKAQLSTPNPALHPHVAEGGKKNKKINRQAVSSVSNWGGCREPGVLSPCPASLGCVHTLPGRALGGVQRGLQRPRTS